MKSKGRAGQDRWLVSYADFITLLFGFFVVLYAFAKSDHLKQQEVSAAINQAFHPLSASGSSAASESVPSAVMMQPMVSPFEVKDDLVRMQRELSGALSGEIAAHAVSIEMGRDGLVISLREAGFFDSGSAVAKPEAIPTLRKIAAALGGSPYDLRVEGHTDNQPIHNDAFASNWELSTARAISIARLLLDLKAISPDRLSAAGYAEFHPVAGNDTAEGRAKNRRVDLLIMPRTSIDFATQRGTNAKGPWRKISDGDAAASQQAGKPSIQP